MHRIEESAGLPFALLELLLTPDRVAIHNAETLLPRWITTGMFFRARMGRQRRQRAAEAIWGISALDTRYQRDIFRRTWNFGEILWA